MWILLRAKMLNSILVPINKSHMQSQLLVDTKAHANFTLQDGTLSFDINATDAPDAAMEGEEEAAPTTTYSYNNRNNP